MENKENHTTIADIMKKSKSESHGRTQSNKEESPHSPLRFHSPLNSDQFPPPDSSPEPSPDNSPENPYTKAIVPVDKYYHYSPHRSPPPEPQKPAPPPPENTNSHAEKLPSPVVVFNRSMREQQLPAVTKVSGPGSGGGGRERFGGGGEEGRGERRPEGRTLNSVPRRSQSGKIINKAALGFRVSEMVLCLISFSVMAADKTQGWAGDSFDRYKEYRYCLSVAVIGFVYSGFQAYDLAYHLITGKHVIQHHLRNHFDFFMDQILAYLIISASSAAAARVDDWQSNWGKDEFTVMASASISMAFLAFAAFALSSLISGYNLCNRNITT